MFTDVFSRTRVKFRPPIEIPGRLFMALMVGLVMISFILTSFHVAPLPADPNLATLFGAVASRTSVTLRYHGEERVIDPYRLEFQRGRWYLTG